MDDSTQPFSSMWGIAGGVGRAFKKKLPAFRIWALFQQMGVSNFLFKFGKERVREKTKELASKEKGSRKKKTRSSRTETLGVNTEQTSNQKDAGIARISSQQEPFSGVRVAEAVAMLPDWLHWPHLFKNRWGHQPHSTLLRSPDWERRRGGQRPLLRI